MLRKLNDKFQENFSRGGIIDARARYRSAARRLRNTDLCDNPKTVSRFVNGYFFKHWDLVNRPSATELVGMLFCWDILSSQAILWEEMVILHLESVSPRPPTLSVSLEQEASAYDGASCVSWVTGSCTRFVSVAYEDSHCLTLKSYLLQRLVQPL
jgi:hypothetical protein